MELSSSTGSQSLAPQPPVPPEIEGYLKKLKRKTSSNLRLTGSWNKRWFFVDPRRREFGYATSKDPNAPRSSIFLDDITAVMQFDDTHFQVESRTRNFFLCGESKASTCCWVSTLDEYRKKRAAYDKDRTAFQAASKLREQDQAATKVPVTVSLQQNSADGGQIGGRNNRRSSKTAKKTKSPPKPAQDEPSRTSPQSSSRSSHSSSGHSSGRHTRRGNRPSAEDRRSPSPTSTPEPSPPAPSRDGSSRQDRVPRGRERGFNKEPARAFPADSDDDDRDDVDGDSIIETSARGPARRGGGARDSNSNAPRAAAGRGRVMQAWIDEDFD